MARYARYLSRAGGVGSWPETQPLSGTRTAGDQAEVIWEVRKGGVTSIFWRTSLSDKVSRDTVGAAIAVDGNTIFVARYGRISTGCLLYAFDRKSGKLRWRIPLRGVGPVNHSQYYNRVKLEAFGGQVTVRGHEGPGTGYIEVRDAITGGLRAHRTLKVQLPLATLAERIFATLDAKMRGNKSVKVPFSDFGGRYNLPSVSPAQRYQAFFAASAAINKLKTRGIDVGFRVTIWRGKYIKASTL